METDGKRSARRGRIEKKRMRRSRVSLRLRAGRRRDKKCLVVRSPATAAKTRASKAKAKARKEKRGKKRGEKKGTKRKSNIGSEMGKNRRLSINDEKERAMTQSLEKQGARNTPGRAIRERERKRERLPKERGIRSSTR